MGMAATRRRRWDQVPVRAASTSADIPDNRHNEVTEPVDVSRSAVLVHHPDRYDLEWMPKWLGRRIRAEGH